MALNLMDLYQGSRLLSRSCFSVESVKMYWLQLQILRMADPRLNHEGVNLYKNLKNLNNISGQVFIINLYILRKKSKKYFVKL